MGLLARWRRGERLAPEEAAILRVHGPYQDPATGFYLYGPDPSEKEKRGVRCIVAGCTLAYPAPGCILLSPGREPSGLVFYCERHKHRAFHPKYVAGDLGC